MTRKPQAPSLSALQVTIETGRKHQIRKHLESIGHPIVGDRLYGKPARVPLQLLAVSLEFDCPFSRQRVKLELSEPLNRLDIPVSIDRLY
jgi:tRNA pseudouridine32 synthase/23S rRNA pseudouridine746 synthase